MSAIFGIVSKRGIIDEMMVNRMQLSLLERAVDGKAVYTNNNMMFGHHKLIVHRRQALEKQPLELDECIITCDARIDNIEELSSKLQLVDTNNNFTDPFIILQAYKRWGIDCGNHLEGEFCFAIWNRKTCTFFGASDQIGFRTFYYHENDSMFAFSSNIKALEDVKTEQPDINDEVFIEYYRGIYHPITYDKNIQVLKSGHYVQLEKNGKSRCKPYWRLKRYKRYKHKERHQWSDYLLKLMTYKIKCQLNSDFPIGIALSGGLDSSFVAAIACGLLKEEGRKLLAFCSVLPENYEGPDKDERMYIEKLKEHFDNLEVHYVVIPDEKGPYSDLEEAFNAIELPANIFHYIDSAIYQYAREQNVRSFLSGYGGDMTISYSGNGVIYQYLSDFKFFSAYRLFRKQQNQSKVALKSLISKEILGRNPIYQKIRKGIKKDNNNLHLPLKKSYLKRIFQADKVQSSGYKTYFINSVNKGETGSELLSLRKHAQAFNQECLTPMLAKEIIELFVSIPGEFFTLNGIKRSLIRETMKKMVPEEISSRTDKMPYSPDFNKRAAKININFFNEFLRNCEFWNDKAGIDYEALSILISKIPYAKTQTEWKPVDELFIISKMVIAAKFELWICKKNTKNVYRSYQHPRL